MLVLVLAAMSAAVEIEAKHPTPFAEELSATSK